MCLSSTSAINFGYFKYNNSFTLVQNKETYSFFKIDSMDTSSPDFILNIFEIYLSSSILTTFLYSPIVCSSTKDATLSMYLFTSLFSTSLYAYVFFYIKKKMRKIILNNICKK